ncbi:MAG: hypothetical protein COA38_02785 [Fluviicola sp.]|nr:MAG: hypothetical protein COA38_02785 [Fluviicola sp.]
MKTPIRKMTLFNSLFKSRRNNQCITDQFSNSIQAIIAQIDKIDSAIDDDGFYDIIQKNTSNSFESNEIYIFLPIAFIKAWIPLIEWKDEYFEQEKNGSKTSKKYNNNEAYLKINELVEQYFNVNPKRNSIIQIAGRSAEFHAINQLLNDGGAIEDVKIVTTTILR